MSDRYLPQRGMRASEARRFDRSQRKGELVRLAGSNQLTLDGDVALCSYPGCGHRAQDHKVHVADGCQCSCMVSCYYCKGDICYHEYQPGGPKPREPDE